MLQLTRRLIDPRDRLGPALSNTAAAAAAAGPALIHGQDVGVPALVVKGHQAVGQQEGSVRGR